MTTHSYVDDYHRALVPAISGHLFPAGPEYRKPAAKKKAETETEAVDGDAVETKVVRAKPGPKPKATEGAETK